MQANLETVRVAELYAGHPLLRHMPVPHFRLPEVNLDIPVVINRMEEATAGESPRGAVALADLRRTFDSVLTMELAREGIRLKPEHKKTIKSVLDDKVVALAQPREMPVDVISVAEEMARAVALTMTESGRPREPIEPERVKRLETKLKETARREFIKLRKPPPRLHVLVTTAEIREAGPIEVVARLQLKVIEEAFEWTIIETDGREKSRLVPE